MKKRPTGHTRNLWPPHFRTFCELVEGEENKLTTFSTWTIMLGCNGNGRNSQVFGQAMKNLWPPHFRTFCELVEGEENKLTTSSTWTIMLGCNESNIIFQQHLCTHAILSRDRTEDNKKICTVLPIHLYVYNLWSDLQCEGVRGVTCEEGEGEGVGGAHSSSSHPCLAEAEEKSHDSHMT